MDFDRELRIGLIALIAILLFFIFNDLILQHLKDAWATHKRKRFKKKFKTMVIGEIVGMEQGGRLAVCDYIYSHLGDSGFKHSRRSHLHYPVYSARVSYTIGDCIYEANANAYTIDEPIIGQKVYVHYNPQDPAKMCVGDMVDEDPEVVKVGRQPLRPIAMLKMRGYHSEAVGEVVRIKKKKFGCKGLAAWLGKTVTDRDVYSSVVQYKVLNTMYEIDAGNYSEEKPRVGDKAVVKYYSIHPEKACVPTWKRYPKCFQVIDCDEEFAYCEYEQKKHSKVPIARVEEGVKPGDFVVCRYGFYQR